MSHLQKRSFLKAFGLVAILISIVLLGACGAKSSGERGAAANTAPKDDPTITITVGKSEARQVASVITATGSLIANETSDVAPKVAGKVANVYANVGQFITQGAVLAKLDDSDALQRLNSARAGVAQAQAGLRQAEARIGLGSNGTFSASAVPEVRAANANYQQALAELKQAQTNEQRYRELVESGDVAMITYDQYRTARDTAQAKADNARQQLEAAVNQAKQNNQAIAGAQAGVQAAQAQVSIAQQAVADTQVHAPFSGFVTARPVAVGEYVASSNAVVTMVKTNPIKVDVQIPQADIPAVTIGAGVSIAVDAYPDRKFAGTVTAINQAVDPTSRSGVIEAQIQNDTNALKPGMFATAQINRQGGGTAVYVPKSAVYNDPATQSYRVFTIDNGVAKLNVVQLGAEEGDSYQILSGLEPDKVVAISNVDQLYEGAKVAY